MITVTCIGDDRQMNSSRYQCYDIDIWDDRILRILQVLWRGCPVDSVVGEDRMVNIPSVWRGYSVDSIFVDICTRPDDHCRLSERRAWKARAEDLWEGYHVDTCRDVVSSKFVWERVSTERLKWPYGVVLFSLLTSPTDCCVGIVSVDDRGSGL